MEVNGKRSFNLTEREPNLVYRWFQDKKGIGAGVYCHGSRQKLSFSVRWYTMVFWAEVYAIKACAVKKLLKNYKNRTSLSCQIIKLQLKHLAITRSPHNWSGLPAIPHTTG
jgi:hypothetical protein